MKLIGTTGFAVALVVAALGAAGAERPDMDQKQVTNDRAVNLCSSCHGPRGISTSPEFPILAGQKEAYLATQMKAFRNRTRSEKEAHDFMWGIAAQMDDAAIAAIARYYAAQSPAEGRPASSTNAMKGKDLFEKGAPERGIVACATCHGKNAEGGADAPRLASQHAKYIAKQLRYMQTQERDVATMRAIVKDLTPDEAQAVALYVQSLS